MQCKEINSLCLGWWRTEWEGKKGNKSYRAKDLDVILVTVGVADKLLME